MKFGEWGEEIAAKYLKKKGYQIIEKNFRSKVGEIDIIAEKNNIICFIEVKTRHSEKYGCPAESITQYKKRHITRTAEYYLLLKKYEDRDARIDVIEILINDGNTTINHIEDAIN